MSRRYRLAALALILPASPLGAAELADVHVRGLAPALEANVHARLSLERMGDTQRRAISEARTSTSAS
jgi:hypothetical protein